MKKNAFQMDPSGWAAVTLRRLEDASVGMDSSAKARAGNERKKRAIANDNRSEAASVSKKLRKKVGETRTLKKRLEGAYALLTEEFEVMTVTLGTTLQLLQNQNQPLKNTKFRLLERKKIPIHLETGDKVQGFLTREVNEITSSISRLVLVVSDIENVMQRMEECRRKLHGDIAHKSAALEIDESCLFMEPPSEESISPADGALVLYTANSSNAISEGSSRIDTRHAAKASKAFPQEWRRNSESIIKAAGSLTDTSEKLRQKILALNLRVVRGNSRFDQQTTAAFEENIRKVHKIRTQVADRRDRVSAELDSLREEKVSLENSLREQDVPLTHCVQRLSLRRQRPNAEATLDAAENSLSSQLGGIKTRVRELEARLAANLKKEKLLVSLLRSLDIEVQEKDHEVALDISLLESDSRYTTSLDEVSAPGGASYDHLLTHFRAIQNSGSNKFMQMFHSNDLMPGGTTGGGAESHHTTPQQEGAGATGRSQTPQWGCASPLIASYSVRACCPDRSAPKILQEKFKPGRTCARLAKPQYTIRPRTALR